MEFSLSHISTLSNYGYPARIWPDRPIPGLTDLCYRAVEIEELEIHR